MSFLTFLKSISPLSRGVLPETIPQRAYIPLDLSSANKELRTSSAYETPQQFEQYIMAYLNRNNGQVAYGGYKEDRDLYRSSRLFDATAAGAARTIHLGVDFWCAANTPIWAPLDGIVHSFKDNNTPGNYGPTIILKHIINEITFYTLYGHLSKASISGIALGQLYGAGTQIGALGDVSVNGGYAPHLHFQLIKDIGNFEGDYQGVCTKKNLGSFSKNCPDPLVLLGI